MRWVPKGEEMHDAGPGQDFEPYVEAVGTATQPAALTWAQSVARTPEVAAERPTEDKAHRKALGLPVPGYGRAASS